MSGNKFTRAAAARAAASSGTGPAPAPATKATMMTTVEVSRHTRAELDHLFTRLRLETGRKVVLGPVTIALWDMLLENVKVLDQDGNPVDLQKEVVRRIT
jgi:hypothetical protein